MPFSFTAEHYCPLLVDNGIMEIVQWLITSPGEKVTELGKRFIDVAKDFNLMRIKCTITYYTEDYEFVLL